MGGRISDQSDRKLDCSGLSFQDNALEPVEGPRKMDAAVEDLVTTLVEIIGSKFAVTNHQAEMFEDALERIDAQLARGSSRGASLIRVANKMKRLSSLVSLS